ncbi:MAG: hypothetical protein KAT70_03545, partial [Thermoplasmata archaeon]|nr:hypothetical protein [Thermoplasmata archaeon]
LIQTLEEMFEKTITLFATLLTNAGFKIASDLLGLFMGEGDRLGPITVFGFTLLITVHEGGSGGAGRGGDAGVGGGDGGEGAGDTRAERREDDGAGLGRGTVGDGGWLNISLGRESGGFEAWVNIGEEDASLHTNIEFWNLHAAATVTSLVNQEYEGFVEWNDHGSGWVFDFHGPEIATYSKATISLAESMGGGIVIPTPAGPATVDLGLNIILDRESMNQSVEEELGMLGEILLEGPSSVKDRLNPAEDIMGTAELAVGLVEFAFTGDPMEKLDVLAHDISEAMVVEFFLDITMGVQGTGMGCTLSIVVTDPLFTMAEVIPWLIESIGSIVADTLHDTGSNTGGAMTSSPGPGELAAHAMENISVRLEMHCGSDAMGRDMGVGVEANLPFFCALAGTERGVWCIGLDLTYTRLTSHGTWLDEYETTSSFTGEIKEMHWEDVGSQA